MIIIHKQFCLCYCINPSVTPSCSINQNIVNIWTTADRFFWIFWSSFTSSIWCTHNSYATVSCIKQDGGNFTKTKMWVLAQLEVYWCINTFWGRGDIILIWRQKVSVRLLGDIACSQYWKGPRKGQASVRRGHGQQRGLQKRINDHIGFQDKHLYHLCNESRNVYSSNIK